MTSIQEYLDRINELMEDSELPYEFKDISDIESFLENEDNQQFEEYEEVQKLYDEMMEISDYEEE